MSIQTQVQRLMVYVLCHLNVHSLLTPGRLDEVYLDLCCLHMYNFDIIAISETHLSSAIPDSDIQSRYLIWNILHVAISIPNYNVFRLDRNRQRGGVLMYMQDRFNTCVRRMDLESPGLELLWAEVKLRSHNIIIGVCHHHPNANAHDIDYFIAGLSDSLESTVGPANQSLVTP